jgi:flagellar biosynthesis component FlhA
MQKQSITLALLFIIFIAISYVLPIGNTIVDAGYILFAIASLSIVLANWKYFK